MEGLLPRLCRERYGTETMHGRVCYQDYAGKGMVLRLCMGESSTETM